MQELVKPSDVLRFCSAAVPENELMEFMHDYYGMTAARMHVDLCGATRPMIDLEALPLDGMVLGKGAIGGVTLARTRPLLSADGIDSILMITSDTPFRGRFNGESESTILPADGLLVATYGASARIHWEEPSRIHSLQIERARLAELLPGFDPDATHRLAHDTHQAGLLFRYADILRGTPLTDPRLRQAAANHLLDLAALVLGATGDCAQLARERGVRAARLASIKDELRARFGDPELSVAGIADRHRISVRYLQVLFEQDGTTYSEFLTALRMEFAAARLRDPRHRHLRIADIAFDAGYSDLTAFNRSFRKRFGETPSRMRSG